MYESVRIRNFRGYSDFELSELSHVNLVAGRNGTGKTALLEALFLLAGGDNSSLVMNIATMRGLTTGPIEVSSLSSQLWETLFHNLDSEEPIQLNATWAQGKRRTRQTVRLSLGFPGSEVLRNGEQFDLHSAGLDSSPMGARAFLQWEHHQSGRTKFKTRLLVDEEGVKIEPTPRKAFSNGFYLATRSRLTPQADADRFGKLELRGDVEGFLDALRVVEPSIRRVTTVSRGGIPVVHADIGLRELLPMSLLGDGVSRLASLMLGIADARNGIALIDELENGFHYSTQPQVWRAILTAAANYHAQLVVTSHSFECMKASLEALESRETDVRLIRIDRTPDGPIARSFPRESFLSALHSDIEIR